MIARLMRTLIWVVERPFIWADDYIEAMAVAARARSSVTFQGILSRTSA
eukprot:CAMPEP_0115890308 /NCGR_PEP_ID=MMETSP0287-20121206/33286_1 /TAXON_ID=412157 /ORGANISM="Chrysochromulina rotalis, Strain UIO044" /LENGTH=48 /DNA_ID= /DNA_START= /DNA_END= /DNA_ORIENTATION=